MSTTKPLPRTQIDDPEALPFSRSPSPIPPPQSNRPTLRGEHYSYESVPTNDIEANGFVIGDDDLDENDTEGRPVRKGSRDLLDIPASIGGSRRSSTASLGISSQRRESQSD